MNSILSATLLVLALAVPAIAVNSPNGEADNGPFNTEFELQKLAAEITFGGGTTSLTVEVETALSFCPYFPKMIFHCEELDETITKGGKASRTA